MSENERIRNEEKRLIIAVLIGWQNEMGHQNIDDPEYKAYQRMIEYLKKELKERKL